MINKKRLIINFKELCKIDAPSGREDALIKYLGKFFKKHSSTAYFDKNKNVLFKIRGEGEPILLNAHLDTVMPTRGIKILQKGNILRTNGKTILGGDDRTGIAMIMELIEHFSEEKIQHRPLEILFTACEEIGLLGSRSFDFKKIKAKEGFILDEEGPISDIIVEAVGYISFQGEIIGKAAHSSEPEKGINALRACCEFIGRIPFGKCSEKTMVNVGIIKGGEVVNAITEKVFIKGEIRSRSKRELFVFQKRIKSALSRINKKYKTKDRIVFKKEFEPFRIRKNDIMITEVAKRMRAIGLKPKVISSMGGSDANIINSNGIKAISLASGYYNCHSKEEFVKISDLLDGVKFLNEFLRS